MMGNRALYTKLCAAVTLLALATGVLAAAQVTRRARKAPRGPRALAVIEFPADEKDPKAQPRLIPVSLLDEGRMWDAAVYRAKPVPMALESGVVYEAEKSGVPQGFFTIDIPRQVASRWIGRGRWEPRTEKSPEAESKPEAAAPAADPDAPPILRKPRLDTAPAARAPEPEKPASTPAPPQKVEPEDPDRPVLRRNPERRKADKEFAEEPAQFRFGRALVALSDATGESSRPYRFQWTADEERRVRAALLEAATGALKKQLGPQPKGSIAPALTDIQVSAFDVEYDNYGDIVLSASWQPTAKPTEPTRVYFLTLVAHLDIESKPRVIFSHVTDSRRLDAQPRLELVDAVDADGDGRGELLFRAVGDRSYSYVLYRIFPQDAVRLTATSEFPLPQAPRP